jgi:hypothetical protein
VIDILSDVKYAKYMKKSKRTYVTDRINANCILASNGVDRYHLSGVPYPEGSNMITVSLVRMNDAEVAELEKTGDPVESSIRLIRRAKIQELSEVCHKNIISGVHVLLSDNKYHHFAMTIEDQINLLEIQQLILAGNTVFIYHETGGEYTEYSVDDMSKIINSFLNHKQEQLMKFNKLKKYINQLTSIEEISSVKFSYMI